MRTEKQIAASRRNGRKSSGAVTADGKARILAANLISGIYAETEVLPWEAADNLEQLKSEYYEHHQPASPEARFLVDELISCEWTLRRLRRADTNLWESGIRHPTAEPEFEPSRSFMRNSDTFDRLQRRINATRLAYHRALKDLERVQARDRQATAAPHPEQTPATNSNDSYLPILGSLRQPPARHAPPLPPSEPGTLDPEIPKAS
jgi:hypothetical protein